MIYYFKKPPKLTQSHSYRDSKPIVQTPNEIRFEPAPRLAQGLPRMFPGLSKWLLLSLALIMSGHLHAQNIAGVYGPGVQGGARQLQYRIAYEERGDGDRWNQWLHYQWSFNDRIQMRILTVGADADGSSFGADFVEVHTTFQLETSSEKWSSGLRLDTRVGLDDNANLLGLGWTNDYRFADGWTGRGLVRLTRTIGGTGDHSENLETRWALIRRFGSSVSGGVELYNGQGTLSNIDLSSRRLLGPFVSFNPAPGWNVYLSTLVDLENSAGSTDLRVFVSRNF